MVNIVNAYSTIMNPSQLVPFILIKLKGEFVSDKLVNVNRITKCFRLHFVHMIIINLP